MDSEVTPLAAAPQPAARGDTAILLVRLEAAPLGEYLAERIGATVYAPTPEQRPRELLQQHFHEYAGWVFVMASGIASRFLSGLPASKYSDPAVVLLDEGATFATSLLSGHEGGANALAYRVSQVTGAVPVISTATEATKPLTVGLGCRKGVSEEQIARAMAAALPERLSDVREIATVDLKAQEAGLLAFCERHDIPLRIFDRESLAARPFVSQPSQWVQQVTGAVGVCEPCALLARPRGRLLVPKMALDGVTVAVTEDIRPWEAQATRHPPSIFPTYKP